MPFSQTLGSSTPQRIPRLLAKLWLIVLNFARTSGHEFFACKE